jgi:hypothetical protein
MTTDADIHSEYARILDGLRAQAKRLAVADALRAAARRETGLLLRQSAKLAEGHRELGITGYQRYALAQRRGHGHVAALLDAVMPEALPPEERLTAAEAAARAGISEGTWKGYVSRGQAPVADWRDLASGRAAWAATTVDAWLAARPGQGARTDLGEAAGT